VHACEASDLTGQAAKPRAMSVADGTMGVHSAEARIQVSFLGLDSRFYANDGINRTAKESVSQK
jgi:hypothetical protein